MDRAGHWRSDRYRDKQIKWRRTICVTLNPQVKNLAAGHTTLPEGLELLLFFRPIQHTEKR
jgi:hypothetical protein|tara:strand:- start:239 stop:421 length:183 start_codon:yes stop_codon:yes gene_type:complete